MMKDKMKKGEGDDNGMKSPNKPYRHTQKGRKSVKLVSCMLSAQKEKE
jgi:hypothetical protein